MDLNSVELFVRVAQKGSFSAASRHTGVPVATVSRRVSALEQSLGVRLLERSTRHLRLTGAGSTLYDYVSRGVQEMDAGRLALQDRESELRGTLRLSVPSNFEPWWALLKDFRVEFPQIEIDVYATERNIDFIEDGVDVTLRIGEVDYLSAVARPLLSYRHLLVATPGFIKMHGSPQSPQDLANFPCVAWAIKDTQVEWTLAEKSISIQPVFRTNDYSHMRYLVLQNSGITQMPPFFVNDLIREKQLVHILPEYALPEYKVSLIYPGRKQLSRIARVYIDYCISNSEKYLNFVD